MAAVEVSVSGPVTVTVGTAGVRLTFAYPLKPTAGVVLIGGVSNTGTLAYGTTDGVVTTPADGVVIPVSNTDRTNSVLVPAGMIDKGKAGLNSTPGLYIGSSAAGNKLEITPWFA